jgi:hypothetical protein
MGAVVNSYMRKGFLIYCMRKCANISPYNMRIEEAVIDT